MPWNGVTETEKVFAADEWDSLLVRACSNRRRYSASRSASVSGALLMSQAMRASGRGAIDSSLVMPAP